MRFIKAAISHRGLALVEVSSPGVTTTSDAGSTKGYKDTRYQDVEAAQADSIAAFGQIEITDPLNGRP
jgi:pyruvate/2-oxoacid:ferredoxin oxidoreductase beta subunit